MPIRRSTLSPAWVRTLAAASPPRRDSAESPCVASASASAAGSSVVAIRSRSLQVSVQRRAEPGDLDPVRHARAPAGRERISSAIGSTLERSSRSPIPSSVHSLQRGEDVLLGLRAEAADPGDPALLGRLLELRRGSRPRARRRSAARSSRRGRAPGSPRPAWPGTSPSACRPRGCSPVSIRVSIFSASVLPTPGSSVSRPSSASCSTETGLCATVRAASR